MKTVMTPMSRGARVGSFSELVRKIFLYHNNYLILICAFMLGNSGISAGLPVGAVFYAACCGNRGIRFLTAVAVFIGTLVQGSLETIYLNIAFMLLFSVLSVPLKNKASSTINLKASIVVFFSVLIPQMLLSALQGFLLYDILKAILSSFISFVLYFIFSFSLPVIAGISKKTIPDNEEIISTAVTAALVLSGMGMIQLVGFSIRNIICVLVLLLLSNKCGAGVGAASGAIIGLIISISAEATPSVAGTYALCGMLAGIFGKLGRIGTALGFIFGNMILAIYFNGTIESMLLLKEIMVAAVPFCFLPNSVINRLTSPFITDAAELEDRRGYSQRIRDITVERLMKFSKAFKDLSKTFEEIAGIGTPAEKRDINILFDTVADRICSDCSLCMHCWERNFYDTYQVMFQIVEKLEMKGRVEECDVPGYFLDMCPRINEFVNAVNNMYELFKVNIVWKSKLGESRIVISRQFEGMSRVITGLAREIGTDVSFLSPLEDAIAAALVKWNAKAREVIAYKNAWGKYEITIYHNSCGGARSCISIIEKVVSEVAGRRMVRENTGCNAGRNGTCLVKLVEAEDLKLTTAVSRLPKFGSNVSGDSFSFMNNGNGKYILTLSDGMGSGHNAAVQSKATVDLLESFLESGFDKDMAINLVNSVLVLGSEEDVTCTIDMSIVDLFSGEVEFVKIGAAPTYIRREAKVDIIRSASLPAGILPGIDAELARRNAGSGDMIIMVTDGIIDSMAGEEAGDRQLMKHIQSIESLNPQEVADSILTQASSCCADKPCDDLTVLVAKIWKKPQ